MSCTENGFSQPDRDHFCSLPPSDTPPGRSRATSKGKENRTRLFRKRPAKAFIVSRPLRLDLNFALAEEDFGNRAYGVLMEDRVRNLTVEGLDELRGRWSRVL
jgi:hypothetical protein